MADEGKTGRTLEQAFAGLAREVQDHCERTARYGEIIFTYAVENGIYRDTAQGARELAEENIPLMAAAGRYHHIEEPLEEMLAGDKRFKAAQRKLLLTTLTKYQSGEYNRHLGCILALASDLDKLVMELVSEHPLEDALKEMKRGVPEKYDPEFYRAMRSSKAKLGRVFESVREQSRAVPAAEPLIKRRVTRPMELVYRPVCEAQGETYAWEASMRFRNVKDNTLPYEEVKHIITRQGIGADICEYFCYEACDTVRRFEACGVGSKWIGLEVLPVFYNRKKLAGLLQEVFAAEEVAPEKVRLMISARGLKKLSKALAENMKECVKAGISFVLTDVTREYLETGLINGEDYPFAAIRFTSECLMDHTLQESVHYQHWISRGAEILADEVENKSVADMVLENGAVGYTGIFAGIYEREDDIVQSALRKG